MKSSSVDRAVVVLRPKENYLFEKLWSIICFRKEGFLRNGAIDTIPNPILEGQSFSVRVFFPWPQHPVNCKGARYSPFAFVAQLQKNCITRAMTRICDRAYNTVGISWNSPSTPGGL